jgi:dTDP-4-dehydrorhamnose reductase
MGLRPSELGPWLIVGASGLFGHGICRYLTAGGARAIGTAHKNSIDVPGVREVRCSLDQEALPLDLITAVRPGVVVYAAGITNVDECETDEPLANRLHAEIPAALAAASDLIGAIFILISTDHLWDGTGSMVSEDEPPKPVNAYARSKAMGEAMVTAASSSALIVRTNFFGDGRPWRKSLSDWMLEQIRSGKSFNAFVDAHFTPIGLPLLYDLIVEAAAAGLRGVYHAGGSERLSKHDFAVRLAHWCGYPAVGIHAGFLAQAQLRARRPRDMSLSSQRLAAALGRPMPDVAESLRAVFGRSVCSD